MKNITLLIILLAISGMMTAQVAGASTTVSKRIDFKESFKDLNLDPNPKTGAASRVSYTKKFQSDKTSDVGPVMEPN